MDYLPKNLISDLNYEATQFTAKRLALVTKPGALPSPSELGTFISEYMPQILQALNLAATLSGTKSAIQNFFAEGDRIFNPPGGPAAVVPIDPTPVVPSEAATG